MMILLSCCSNGEKGIIKLSILHGCSSPNYQNQIPNTIQYPSKVIVVTFPVFYTSQRNQMYLIMDMKT